jgi:hypothetical protein
MPCPKIHAKGGVPVSEQDQGTQNTSGNASPVDFTTRIPEALKQLELKAFKELLERQAKGEKLTSGDLALMKRMRALYPDKKDEPEASNDEPLADLIAELASRPGISPDVMRFKPVSEVARLIGCSDKNLKNYCTPAAGSGIMALPHKRTGKHGAYLVQPAVAYEFLLRFGQKAPKGLKAPPGYVAFSAGDGPAPQAIEPAPPSPQPATLVEPVSVEESYDQAIVQLQRAILNQGEFDKLGGNERVRVMGALLETLRRHKSDMEKMDRRFTEHEVISIAQAIGREWVRQFTRWTPGMAELLDKYIAEKFNYKLSEHNSAARTLLHAQIQNHGETMIINFRAFVDEQVKGVQYMKGTQ